MRYTFRPKAPRSLLTSATRAYPVSMKRGLKMLMLALSSLFPVSELIAQGSIPCDGSLYFTRQLSSSTRISAVNIIGPSDVTITDKVTLNPNASTNATVYYNGYVFTQNWSPNTFTLVRVSSFGGTNNYTSKTVSGMPNNVDYNNAGVDKNGIMYILSTDAQPILYKIDLKAWNADGTGTLTATTATCTMTTGSRLWGDIAFDPLTNKAYAWYHPSGTIGAGQATRGLYEIQNISTSTPSIVKVGTAADYVMGTLFFNERGQLFSYGVPSTGGDQVNLYQIDKATSAVTVIGTSDASPQSDGCECAYRLSLTLTAGDNKGHVNIPNCTKPSDFDIQFAATNTATGDFSGVTFAFPLDPRFTFAKSQAEIETYLKTIFGSQVVVTLSSTGGGTNNLLNATGLAVSGTTNNGGSTVTLPFAIKVAVASGGSNFTNGEKVNFQAEFGGLSAYYGTTEPSSDPLSLYGKMASTLTFNKTDALCNTLSGNVLHDTDGMKNSMVDGTNINTNLNLNAVLVNAAGNVVAYTNINTSTGAYSFPIGPGTYSVVLTTATVDNSNIGNSVYSIAVTPPSNWLFIGEHLGDYPDSGTNPDDGPNGVLTNIVITTEDQDKANFGIQQPPTATTLSYVITGKAYSGIKIPLNSSVDASGSGSKIAPPAGSDPDATGNSVSGFIITSLPVVTEGTLTGTGPKLYYNNVEVLASDVTSRTVFPDPSLFSIELNGVGYEGVSFGFISVDAAGAESASATYTVTWTPPLPVTLVSFTARSEDNAMISLTWKTTSEINASNFQLERSADSKQWMLVRNVRAVGSVNALTEYTEYDNNPRSGRNYYRLKMTDLDGSYTYSRIISVNHTSEQNKVAIYPNPGTDRLFVKDIDINSIATISVTDIQGKQVFQQKMLTDQGIDISGLSNGIYSVQIKKKSGEIWIKKLVVQH
jgi:hypothetical protein